MIAAETALSAPVAILLGIVEGATEFLPVSSTGHLAVAERLLDLRSGGADSYAIVIQVGAIAAVVFLYRSRLHTMVAGALGRDQRGRNLLIGLTTAFVPSAVLGVLFGDAIKHRLFGVGPVAAAWAVGALLILAAGARRRADAVPLEGLTGRGALLIGVAQAAALWPGISRSLVTILAGVGVGLTLPAAVEFSFLLGLITLTAATGFELATNGGELIADFGVAKPALGVLVAFVAALASIRWLVRYIATHDLRPFAYYRLLAATIAGALLISGVV